MSAFRRALKLLRALLRRVPLLASVVRLADRLQTRLVATERYEGSETGRDYLEQYAAVILPVTRGRVLDLGCGHGT